MTDTYNEQDELLQYEYTLASCYEAEYLLSLKLQEDMIYGSSSECYYDGFEVQISNPNTNGTPTAGGDQQPLCNGVEASGGTPSSHHEVDDNECGPLSESMEIGGNSDTNSRPLCTQLATANGWLLGALHPQHHQSSHLGKSLDTWVAENATEVGPTAVQNGQEMDPPNLHNEGPSRKRICLHHDI